MRTVPGRFLRVALVLLLSVTLAGVAAPAQAEPQSAVAASAVDWTDDEAQWYRDSVADIADYAAEPEVREAAAAALAAGTTTAVADFVSTGWARARAAATARKSRDRAQVTTWSTAGGTNVRAAAKRALQAGDYAIAEFVAYGHEIAERLDRPVDDSPAEQERIYRRVEQMVMLGGPTVVAEGSTALASADPVVIADFYTAGYPAAARKDWDNREKVRRAVEQRNESLDALTADASAAATAATARREIIRANIDGVRYLEEALLAMRQAAGAANEADQIFEQDRAQRPSGQRGRTALLEARKSVAVTQAGRASQAALQMNAVIARVQVAVDDLESSGQSHGQDWAQVTMAVGLSAQAAAHAAGTAGAAATATLADSLALDADQNATLHAENAARWLAETRYQEQKAKDLAAVAKAQQKIAEDAARRAAEQRGIAEAAADDARRHANNARTLRADAQRAAANAVARAQAAGAAQLAASDAVRRESAAIDRANRSAAEFRAATSVCYRAEDEYNAITQALQRARDEAIAAGKDADEATRDLQVQADRARGAYQAAQGWANRARAAADAARGEAQRASVAAQQARGAAQAAQQEALTARRASDTAGQAAVDAVHAAEAARIGAVQTEAEASAAVQEAGHAVVQADIAGDAAGSAAALADLTVDRAGTASYIASRFAAVNADARSAMAVASEAILVSEQAAAAAARRAAEAKVAADHATEQAVAAVGTIKPAYEAAAGAIQAANTAIDAANKAYAAAARATDDADGASNAAADATQWEMAAWRDASIADHSAKNATNAAAAAGRASASVDRAYAWAKNATAGIHTQATKLAEALTGLTDERARQEAIAREQQEFEDKVEAGLLSFASCATASRACAKFVELIRPSLRTALDATKSHLALLGKCYTGDNNACAEAQANGDQVIDFFVQVAAGLWQGAKNLVLGLKAIVDCTSWVVVGFHGEYFQNNCGKVVDGLEKMPEMLREHPLELIHITEWRENPGKALGLILFDVATFAMPGVGQIGGALSKTAAGINNLLRLGITKLSGGIGRIERFAVRVADVPGESSGRVAQILNVGLRIENGTAKFDEAVALIDNAVYKVDSTAARIDGVVDDLEGAVVHLQDGVVTVENGVARIKDLVLRIDRDVDLPDTPRACGLARVRAAAAAAPIPCNGTQPDGSWRHNERGVDLTLDATANRVADDVLNRALRAEPSISSRITELIGSFRGATLEGWRFRLKGENSLKRKLATTLDGNRDRTPEGVLAKVGDNIRYTATFPFEQYVSAVEEAVSLMKRQGFELAAPPRNGWAGAMGPYKGLNLTWRDPETGHLFELQFHTPESFKINKVEHPFYEIGRLPGEGTFLTKAEANAVSKGLWATVPTPPGAKEFVFALGA
ncbi:ALF repeat-containing protein [Jidongwangia harbinensis]|uniref:ALF repeat-containing protein n=1 Tax=Jidongwangia harbinensis TaxID=2878561 RepID=UPI001CD942C5|nr:ALF repeat-containing protein [Jidongwangia harbinensis]MCA2214130.1 hypothetical protein [Jidongwangia harbinensis]